MPQPTLPILDCTQLLAIERRTEPSRTGKARELKVAIGSAAGLAVSRCGFVMGIESRGQPCIPHLDSASSDALVPRFGDHQCMPPQLVLEPAEHRPRQCSEIPRALVLVLHVLFDNVREDVLFPDCENLVPFEQMGDLSKRIIVSYRAAALGFRIGTDQFL